jgi:hypothetical protein
MNITFCFQFRSYSIAKENYSLYVGAKYRKETMRSTVPSLAVRERKKENKKSKKRKNPSFCRDGKQKTNCFVSQRRKH